MRFAVLFGALSAFVAIVLSAWGAHGLRDSLSPQDLERIAVGARLELWHALALLAIGALAAMRPARILDYSVWAFMLGTILFSGIVYLRALTGFAALSFLVPVGGASFMAGWLLLAWYGYKEHVLKRQ